MEQQPSTLARHLSVTQCNALTSHDGNNIKPSKYAAIDELQPALSRTYFTRSAIFSALATSLVGFGIAPMALAETTTGIDTSSQIIDSQNAGSQNDDTQNTASRSTASSTTLAQPPTPSQPPTPREPSSTEDTQLDIALDALRLKRAVEQGIIDKSVLDDYREQNLSNKQPGIKEPDAQNSLSEQASANQQGVDDNVDNDNTNDNDLDNELYDVDDLSDAQANVANKDLLQQAETVQQQGYQMMTPEEIDRELAALDRQNAQDIDSINNGSAATSTDINGMNGISNNDSDFDAPIATLNDTNPPIGLDVSLDATNLPAPNNLDTLGRNETAAEQAKTAEIMARPINVSDAVSSGSADDDNIIIDDQMSVSADNVIGEEGEQSDIINPNDYLPDYQSETQAVNQSILQAKKPKALSRKKTNIVKRLYDRLFNDGALALPHVETTVYLQQVAADDATNAQPKVIEADEDTQPIKNIKAALDDTTVQSVVDFTAALPRLRQTALDAAKAVGYYDVTLRLRQPNSDIIEVVIEDLGEPVTVDSRIVEIRGEGSAQEEYQALEKELPPQEGDVFNHRVYKNSKAALESLSNTYGYFDQYWLNKSVDIILPDNTADISLVYNTGDRYEYDDVVFFTYDAATNTLTRDPDKLPVELSLLQQLFDFKPGDPFYRPDITKFSNDLSATRYFNTVNVESILPPNESSENSTLAFDNAPANTLDNDVDGEVNASEIIDGVAAANNGAESSNTNGTVQNGTVQNSDEANGSEGTNTANSGETVNPADIAAIEFEADEQTLEKLQAIKQKANRLSRLPDDRVLDEKDQETDTILGKISDSISNVAQKIFPDEKSILADENFVPPTLAGRKTPQQVRESKKVPLYVFVSASKPRDAQVGIGYGTDTGVRATAKIDYNLLNRQGYQAGAETEVSRITKNVSVYASRPWKHPLNDKLDARLTYEEEVIDQGEGNFDLSTRTLKAALARNIRRDSGWNRSYSVRYRLDELETGVDEANLEDLPIRFTSSSPQQQALLLGYGINKTDVDSATNPTRGIRQYYSIEAGTEKALSDTDLAIVRAGVSGIYSFGNDNKHQVLGSLNTGYIWADDFYDVPYKLRFFAGGDQSIRGYDYESLSPIDKGYLTGGQILAVGSAEYNYEFRPGFRGALFTDVGNAYDKDFETETKVGVGVGIRWASPVGVVRVDVAAGVTEESIPVRLHFFIGSPL
ncbi:autotransporter assembly complex protein TamA [Psychrobacter sp. Pi2-51]|uniref:autotransporter assembly complex protein TamA n=1 Tax=Psychrobacter sp. Pi2-51 TaxID=2774132 RepID=UPI00191A384C|nr:BamA/TamA family outer membrane protein [Psychrobacter sp. Pi2-51]